MRKFKEYTLVCTLCKSTFLAKKVKVRFCSAKCNNKSLYLVRDIEAYNKRKRSISVASKRKERYWTDINFRLSAILRARLKMAIKNNHKVGSAVSNLGCTVDELKLHLESKFQPGMTWENHGRYGWHIDHVKPLSSFDLTDESQLQKACSYTNLQPLWARDNISKGAK